MRNLSLFLKADATASPLFIAWLDMAVSDKDDINDVLDWDPETVSQELHDEFKVAIPRINFHKIMACKELVRTDHFYKHLPSFISLCNVLSGTTLNTEEFDPADSEECAWGITEALLLCPPEDIDNAFSDDIVDYVSKVLSSEGYLTAPDILKVGNLKDEVERVATEWSDDPAIHATIWSNNTDKANNIKKLIQGRLGQMVSELKSLHLTQGSSQGIVEKLSEEVSKWSSNEQNTEGRHLAS